MGSTLFLLDHNHEIQKTYRYDAFGNILKEMGELSNRLTYTGQMYDGAAGQYYLRARFYNPAIGRFLQEDTYRGDREGAINTAKRMLSDEMLTLEKIAEYAGLLLDEVKKLKAERTA